MKSPRSIVAALACWLLCVCSVAAASTRFATFNVKFSPSDPSTLVNNLQDPDYAPAKVLAGAIQDMNPDVLLLNEFNYDAGGQAAALLQQNFLSTGQYGQDAVSYPYVYQASVNTGLRPLDVTGTSVDFNNDGVYDAQPEDAFGYGQYAGQYGMMLLSKHPIQTASVRTFQTFLWKDMPGNLRPEYPQDPQQDFWYDASEWDLFRLSSKSHWDVPVVIDGEVVHLLASHPTPPAFDGAEQRNVRRNHDEIRFWADYVSSDGSGDYIYDDAGNTGAMGNEKFVVAGDLNADPDEGDGYPGAIAQLLDHPRVNYDAAQPVAGKDTAEFGLQVDYVLPSSEMDVLYSDVYFPEAFSELWQAYPNGNFDHYAVYADVVVPEPAALLAMVAGGGILFRKRKVQ